MKNVLIIQRRMTEYRVPMFSALQRRLKENGITLHVVYGNPSRHESARNDAGDLTWGIQVKNHYLKMGKSYVVWQSIPRRQLKNQDLIIIPHENMLLMNYALLFCRMCHDRTKIAFWGHGANFQSSEKNRIREKFKSWTTRLVDWWFTYTALSVDKVIANGFPAQRITCLNNAVDVSMLKKWRADINDESRYGLLNKLGLQGSQLAVFLGGLYHEKRLPFLFDIADMLKSELSAFELMIIGDGPQRGLVSDFAASRPWCRWVGARHGYEKVLYASLGQVMLNPGLVGLGILDSFALGIPLITTDCGIHSPEISYLESGRNGFMVANNPQEYVKLAVRMLTDSTFREEMAKHCIIDSAKYSLDNMVNNFSAGIISVLSGDRSTVK